MTVREQTVLLGDSLWISQINENHDGYETVGPCKVKGFELNCDSLRGIDCVIVDPDGGGASHSHHQPADCFIKKEEAEERTIQQNKTMQRRKQMQEQLRKDQYLRETGWESKENALRPETTAPKSVIQSPIEIDEEPGFKPSGWSNIPFKG